MQFPPPYTNHENHVNVIAETPYLSRTKIKYDMETGLYKVNRALSSGLTFPCVMGFIPGTMGEDDDPVDALILTETQIFPGCLVECRLIGVIRAISVSKQKKVRNHRFLFIPAMMREYDHLTEAHQLNPQKLDAIIRFFEIYNYDEGKKFIARGIDDAKKAHQLLRKAMDS